MGDLLFKRSFFAPFNRAPKHRTHHCQSKIKTTKQPNNQTMGNPPPGGSKKKKGRAPKHQNSYAFRHNPKSKKTAKILSSPNVGVCRRCSEKIEWRKKYRKVRGSSSCPRASPLRCSGARRSVEAGSCGLPMLIAD